MLLIYFLAIIVQLSVAIHPQYSSSTVEKHNTLENVQKMFDNQKETEKSLTGYFLPAIKQIFGAFLGIKMNPPARQGLPHGTDKTEKFSLNRLFKSLGLHSPEITPKDLCEFKHGILLNGECLEYFGSDDSLPFDAARSFCKSIGGDLWTPNLNDPFLYQKMMKYLPEVSRAMGEDFWIGVYQAGERTLSVDRNDVSLDYLIQIYDGIPNDADCYVLDYPRGNFVAVPMACSTPQEFVCEYPLETISQKYAAAYENNIVA